MTQLYLYFKYGESATIKTSSQKKSRTQIPMMNTSANQNLTEAK